MGNWAADETAKAAEKSDLSCVPEYTEEINAWYQPQETYFFMFCQHLLETTKAVTQLRKIAKPSTAEKQKDDGTMPRAQRQWLPS